MENGSPAPLQWSVRKDPTMASQAPVRELRDRLNEIVAGCEALKLEPGFGSKAGIASPLDQISALAISLSGDIRSLTSAPDGSTGTGDAQECILRTVRRISEILRHMQKPSLQNEGVNDLLHIESLVQRISQLAQHFTSGEESLSQMTPKVKQVILVVDDDEDNREILVRLLRHEGQEIIVAANGYEAIELLGSHHVDLVLLDLLMPGLDGLAVLRRLKLDPTKNEIPVVMISSVDEIEKAAACINSGADDYVLKPFHAALLRARLRALLERKFLRDLECARNEQLKITLRELEKQKQTAERLLLNILPQKFAAELSAKGRVTPAYFEDVTIVFTDFVSFTSSTEKLAADDLVAELNFYFTAFDEIMDRYELERLKTVGDSYIFLAGVPERSRSHPVDAVLASVEMMDVIKARQGHPLSGWSMRVGVNTGPVISGIVGTRKFAFDVWGDSVNFASRMASSGAANRINLSARTFHRIKDFFLCSPRGEVKIKGNRWVEMYFLEGILPSLLDGRPEAPAAAFRERYKKYFEKELTAFPGIPDAIAQP